MKLFLITLALLTSITINTQARSIMPSQYEVISFSLDKKVFDFENKIILVNKNGDDIYLRILNDICPTRPGLPSCRAAAMLVFDAKFALSSKIETSSCNTKIQTSDVILVNGQKNIITFSDMTQSPCDIVYVSDYKIELKIKNQKGQVSTSVINVSNINSTVKPMPSQNIEEFSMTSNTAVGPFFNSTTITDGEMSLDKVNGLVSLSLHNNPCDGGVCLAISSNLLSRDFKIAKTENAGCNVTKLTTEVKDLYDAYPAVVGATMTKAQLEIYDYRLSPCMVYLQSAGVRVNVKITTESNSMNGLFKGESSEAVLGMSKILN